MAFLNSSIPPIYCKIRKEYLYDLRKHHGESEDCVIFGLTSIQGRGILFNIMLENGACFWRLPISAFFSKDMDRKNVPDMPNDLLELWNSFDYYHSITHFSFLIGQRAKYFGKDKKLYHGEYLFTVDWCHHDSNLLDTDHSEIPQEHKCAHILELDNGNFAAQPNNRILWHVNSFTTRNEIPDYKVQTNDWNVENKDWVTDDTDRFFYEILEKDMNK
tara:strand:+ start:1113 stop:1763 length:651 start_codon:yes stop_codon:yes gene_type:complete